ncbi:hypothetical protein RND81_14G100900 [Saponaria officinalis]|uniref:RING-type E3 ubiquitin transferase n=1 Tax=Saponaria officinalis TaxID=3572 RepID=A0AAW1GNN6_SAPOF
MKKYSRLIISAMFLTCYILNSINGESCYPIKCPKAVNGTAFSTVEYPFRLKDQQNKSCGVPGFDLYCDKTFGRLIQLPNDVVFRVDYISYYHERITLSDPTNCLPRKLMSLNLNNTPFTAEYTENFWVYNCSRDDYWGHDRIDCLSGSNYTVISSWYDNSYPASSNCSLVKMLRAPKSYYSNYSDYFLSNYTTIDLTWTGKRLTDYFFFFVLPPCINGNKFDCITGFATPPPLRYPPSIGFFLGIIGGAIALLIILICCWQYRLRGTAQATSTATGTNADTVVVGGLDQVTIDSYLVVVFGDTGSLVSQLISDDETCSICLSDYQPRETLKLLPHCLHRFHKDCIDQWLRSKGVCPICRTSPPTTTTISYHSRFLKLLIAYLCNEFVVGNENC